MTTYPTTRPGEKATALTHPVRHPLRDCPRGECVICDRFEDLHCSMDGGCVATSHYDVGRPIGGYLDYDPDTTADRSVEDDVWVFESRPGEYYCEDCALDIEAANEVPTP